MLMRQVFRAYEKRELSSGVSTERTRLEDEWCAQSEIMKDTARRVEAQQRHCQRLGQMISEKGMLDILCERD